MKSDSIKGGIFLADKDFHVAAQYGLNVIKSSRGRGAFILETNKGLVLLREYSGRAQRLEAQAAMLEYLRDKDISVDYFIKNNQGSYLTTDEDGVNYTLTRWFPGRECDTKNFEDICFAVKKLAKVHMTLEDFDCVSGDFQIARNLAREYDKHNREIKMIRNYLSGKNGKNDFELLVTSSCRDFLEEGIKACEVLEKSGYQAEYDKAVSGCRLCHGDFNQHNVYLQGEKYGICGFEQACFNVRLWDLYKFMRKILEKYDWEIKLGYLMLKEYDKVNTLSQTDIQLLGAMFSYPEKYWKILNSYYNSNKVWISSKNMEKLKMAVRQNGLRQAFIKTLQ